MGTTRFSRVVTNYLLEAVSRAELKVAEPPDLGILHDPDSTILEAWQAVARAYAISLEDLALCVAEYFKTEVAEVIDVPPHVLKLVPDKIARQYNTIPVREEDRQLFVATSDPTDFHAEQALGFASGRAVVFVIAPPDQLEDALGHYYAPEKAVQTFLDRLGPLDADDIAVVETDDSEEVSAAEADSAPVIQLTNLILRDAIQQDASDVHFEPGKSGGAVRFRVDGVMRLYMQLPFAAMIRVSSRIKILAKMDIADKLRPQDGRAAIFAQGLTYDLRVSTVPTRDGEKIVIRILNPGNAIDLDDLKMTSVELERFRHLLGHRDGLILVTGPTGSGKTTTLYAGIRELSTGEQNIMTVEDPVEYELDSINQIQIEPKKGVTFASALRAILRQDPDVIFVGEIRDGETAEIAVQACMTGHLVLATLHTNDALGVVKRLADLGVDPASMAATLRGAIAQRLVRRVCPDCHEKITGALTPDEKVLAERNGVQPLVRTVGCKTCAESGYRGRLPVTEVVTVTPQLQTLIAKRAPHLEMTRAALANGFRDVRESALDHARAGLTTLAEVERVLGKPSPKSAPEKTGRGERFRRVEDEETSVVDTRIEGLQTEPEEESGEPAPRTTRRKRTTKAKTTKAKRTTRAKKATKTKKTTKSRRTKRSAGGSAESASPVEPMAVQDVAAASGIESPQEGSTEKHVLLVEDDPVTRKQAKRLLSKEGYEVTEAVDGVHAMKRLEKKSDYALMVLDLHMPRLDGRGVLEKVRANVETAKLPIVVLTASTDPEVEIELMDEGADDYIRKPIDPPYFHARIRGVLRRAGMS